MASIQKRKQLVNQLRKAHFPFGFHPTKDIQSEYIEKYRQYQLQRNTQQANGNARKNNFDIGDQNSPNFPLSQFKEKFPQHGVQYKGLNRPEQSKNIVFGYDGSSYDTNYKDDYTKKQKQLLQGKPLDQKKKNIQFGDSLTDFTTTYNQVYDPKTVIRNNVNAPSMRKTNLILGNNDTNYLSQNNAVYQPVPVASYHAAKGNNGSNINLGGDKSGFTSENRAMFAHKEAPKYTVDKQTVRDFRSAHFHFGFPTENSGNFSQAQAQYNQKPLDFVKAQGNRDSNINLSADDANYFNSSYKNDFQQKKGVRQPMIRTGQIDNVLMGTDGNPGMYESQAKGQFINRPVGQRVKGQKHGNNLQLGNQETDYLTHYRNIHTDKFRQRQNAKLDQQAIKKLKDKNFYNGFERNNYSLTSANYGNQLGPANKLNKQTLDGMKNTNIHTGDQNPFAGNSIYKSSFPWKKNDQF